MPQPLLLFLELTMAPQAQGWVPTGDTSRAQCRGRKSRKWGEGGAALRTRESRAGTGALTRTLNAASVRPVRMAQGVSDMCLFNSQLQMHCFVSGFHQHKPHQPR